MDKKKLIDRILREATFTLQVVEDSTPVRGNAMASGDEAYDREVEEGILSRLDEGDIWGWAWIHMTATWNGLEGEDSLGGCSYEDEADFIKNSGYYEDMKFVAAERIATEFLRIGQKFTEISAEV